MLGKAVDQRVYFLPISVHTSAQGQAFVLGLWKMGLYSDPTGRVGCRDQERGFDMFPGMACRMAVAVAGLPDSHSHFEGIPRMRSLACLVMRSLACLVIAGGTGKEEEATVTTSTTYLWLLKLGVSSSKLIMHI